MVLIIIIEAEDTGYTRRLGGWWWRRDWCYWGCWKARGGPEHEIQPSSRNRWACKQEDMGRCVGLVPDIGVLPPYFMIKLGTTKILPQCLHYYRLEQAQPFSLHQLFFSPPCTSSSARQVLCHLQETRWRRCRLERLFKTERHDMQLLVNEYLAQKIQRSRNICKVAEEHDLGTHNLMPGKT